MNMAILHPRLLLLLVVTSSTLIWFLYPPMFSYQKYWSVNGFANYLFFYLIILACCFLTEKTSLSKPAGSPLERFRQKYAGGDALRREAFILAVIAGAAQLLWIVRIVLKEGIGPLIQMLVVRQDFLAFKQQVVNVTGISGVTTLTQLGLLASSLYAIHVFGLKRKGSFWMWALILFPGVLRGLFFSERIALLEVVLPIAVIAILFGSVRVTLPKLIASLAAVVLFFSAAEGLRSYQFYSQTGFAKEGVYSYGLGRFLDYISSSINHSMAMPDLAERSVGFPTLMFNGWINLLYNFIPESTLRAFLHLDAAKQAYLNVKSSPYSAPDYTNMGYFGELFADSGYLYVVYAVLYGWFIGMAYKGIRQHQVGWMMIFPSVVFSLLEVYRVHYLFDNRMFYPLLYVFLRYLYQSYQESKSPQPRWEGGEIREAHRLA
ncbi:hypothetical protein GE107_20235 [Cohnella sp. CFH 77786]|uniref:hypothetical protein n=1 Tax=Cohnella sp. CFH 77786 TaxID=2662265 RepID=UPI001C60EF80|nr:hypothetical protein [Cohnella sp. CFH 77786]MBW5448376.1 hypothetical protein [Cohnella sp. CFH 77786]